MQRGRKFPGPLEPADHDRFLDWRGIEVPCPECKGSGRTVYGSTATWRGGVGGCSMTADVCDACWGSGDKAKPWTDLRKLRDEETQRVELRAGELLAHRLGAKLALLHPGLLALADELERLSRGRKARPYHFYELCETLAKLLRAMVGSKDA